MADPENLRKNRIAASARSAARPATEVQSQHPNATDQVLNLQQQAGNTAVNQDLLSRSRPSGFTNEDIHESIGADTFSEPSQQASSLVREGQLGTRRSPGGKSQPVPLEGGNFTHKYAEPLRRVLPPPEIPARFAGEVEKGNVIPLAELPDGLLAEQHIGSLFRADRVTSVVDAEKGIIYEIKPDTVSSIRNGQNQVLRSVELANQSAYGGRRNWRGIVVVYNRKAARRFVTPPARPTPEPPVRRTGGGGPAEPAQAEPSSLDMQHYDIRPPAESAPMTGLGVPGPSPHDAVTGAVASPGESAGVTAKAGETGKAGGAGKGGGGLLGDGAGSALAWFGAGVLESWLRGKAIQREVREKGYVPVGPLAFADESKFGKIARWFTDPTMESNANPVDRFDVTVWRNRIRAEVAKLPAGQASFGILFNLVSEERPEVPHGFADRHVDDVPVTYDRGVDGQWQPRVPEGGRVVQGRARFGQVNTDVPDLNRILDESVTDDDVMEMVFPGYHAAKYRERMRLLYGTDSPFGEGA